MKELYLKLFLGTFLVVSAIFAVELVVTTIIRCKDEIRSVESHELYMRYLQLKFEQLEAKQEDEENDNP